MCVMDDDLFLRSLGSHRKWGTMLKLRQLRQVRALRFVTNTLRRTVA